MLVSIVRVSLAARRVLRGQPGDQTMHAADPAPIVHKGMLYLFSSHDEDVGEKNNFNMKNWVLP